MRMFEGLAIVSTSFTEMRTRIPKRFIVCSIVFLTIFWSTIDAHTQVAVPSFTIIGERYDQVTNLWIDSGTNILAKQITMDYNPRGIIYGLTCEYSLATNTFYSLKTAVQERVKLPLRIEKTNFCLWRSEERKITVTLEFVEDDKVVRLIVVSVDKHVRDLNSTNQP